MQKVHFIGIGGVGMNGLAQLAVQSGYSVSGSDRAYAPETALFSALEKQGISIFPQDGSAILETTDQVVYSTAIENDNPDLQKARQLGIPQLHRAEFLKELVGKDELIAIAGTAGKTTTTGLLSWIFEALGKDPSVYNGAGILNWKNASNPGNIRKGKSKLWIIEADESDKSFLKFSPTHSIITNISKDHYELEELHRMFDQFQKQTTGYVIKGAPLELAEGQSNTFIFQGQSIHVPMLGKHNLENAHNAVQLCAKLGMNMDKVRDVITQFKGIERRLQITGKTANSITIIDDYAHNAAKISAALASVAEIHPRVHAYWRPHGFSPLAQGFNELTNAFSKHWMQYGGSIFILPVYFAGGTVQRTTSSEAFVDHLNSAGIPAQLVKDYPALQRELKACAHPGDAILGMGARDPELPQFSKKLVTTWTTI